MNPELTKDAKKMIRAMYKNYRKKQKTGASKPKSKDFGSFQTIHVKMFPKWSFDNINDTCRELERAGFIKCLWAGDRTAYHVWLLDSCIVYGETHFKNIWRRFFDFSYKFVSLLR